MKILLTGSEGFIGSHFQKKIKCIRYDLINGDDIRDKFKLDNLFNKEKFDLVVNLAARAGVPMGEEYYEEYISTNLIGLKTLIEVCKKHKVKLIHFSSSSALTPISVYGITKLAGEKLVEASGVNYVIIRPFTVIGENGRKEMVLYKWLGQYQRGEKISFYGDGTTFRGYTYVGDLIDGTIKSFKLNNKTLNLGGSQKITLEELWNIFKELYPDAKREILPLPDYDIKGSLADTTQAFELLDWTPKTDVRLKIIKLLK
jgi:UDP-glucuronate 4-epimerase